MIECFAMIVIIVAWLAFVNYDDNLIVSDKPRHVPNPFGAITGDSMGRIILPDKKRWDESPEFYAAQCEVEDYLMEKK